MNVTTATLKENILGALDDVGGRSYLVGCAREYPVAFMSLIGRVLPTTLASDPSAPLFPERSDPKQIASAILSIIQGSRPAVKDPVLIENSRSIDGKVDGLTIEHEPETAETLGKSAENDE